MFIHFSPILFCSETYRKLLRINNAIKISDKEQRRLTKTTRINCQKNIYQPRRGSASLRDAPSWPRTEPAPDPVPAAGSSTA